MLLERVVLPITNTFSEARTTLAFSSDKTIGAWAIAPSKTKGSSAISGAAKSLANFSISATLNPARSWPTITRDFFESVLISIASALPISRVLTLIPESQSELS